MTTSLKDIESPSDYPVFTFCSKNQYSEFKLKSYGIQSSKSYAMDTDWVGSGSEEPNRIFEDSVPTVEDIISDITFYLDRPTVDGQTIVSLAADGKYCGRSFFRAQHPFYYGRC